jgi:hypothetical protein
MPNAPDLLNVAKLVLGGTDDPWPALRELVQHVTRDPDAYLPNEHVLGFVHCRLGEFEGRTVRLHIWPKENRELMDPVWPVHTHHWTISSAVIAGHVLNETFEVQRDLGGTSQLYRVEYSKGGLSERRKTGDRVSVARQSRERWDAGAVYEIPLKTYHSTTVPDGLFAATVIVTGQQTRDLPLVVGDAAGDDRYEYRVRPTDHGRWRGLLAELNASMALRDNV